jgi:NADH-quinone oxidoreductase subunit A
MAMVAVSVMIFVAVGTVFLLANLFVGGFLRRRVPTSDKLAAYECGEAPVGSSWVQFDLRFYIVALVYLVFAVEVVLLYPWAVVYGSAVVTAAEWGVSVFELRLVAFGELLLFLAVVTVGLAYLWKFGYLDWVRSMVKDSSARTVGAKQPDKRIP